MDMTPEDFAAAACSALGYQGGVCAGPSGGQWTEGEIASAAAKSYLRHRRELPPLPCGGRARDYRRALKDRTRAAKELVAADIGPSFGLDKTQWMGILGAIAAFIFGGAGALILSIIMSVVEWAITAELEKRVPAGE